MNSKLIGNSAVCLVMLAGLSAWGQAPPKPKPKPAPRLLTHRDATLHDAPDDCGLLLKDGVFDKTDVFGSNFQTATYLNYVCKKDYSTLQEADSDSFTATVPIEDVMVGLGFSDASTNFTTDYHAMCSNIESYSASSSINHESISKADGALAKAFVACVAGKHFVSYATPVDPTQFNIYAQYNPIGQDDQARIINLDYDTASVTCNRPPSKVIGPEGMYILCSRKNKGVAAQLALNTTSGSASYKIPAYVAPLPPPPSTSKVGDIVMSIESETDFSAARPGEVWVLCDGRAAPPGAIVTVIPDFQGRYPRGHSTAPVPDLGPGETGEVGTNVAGEIQSHSHNVPLFTHDVDHGSGETAVTANPNPTHNYPSDSYGGHETRPNSVIVNFFIRVR